MRVDRLWRAATRRRTRLVQRVGGGQPAEDDRGAKLTDRCSRIPYGRDRSAIAATSASRSVSSRGLGRVHVDVVDAQTALIAGGREQPGVPPHPVQVAAAADPRQKIEPPA
jgi:hypothetical protein